MKTSIALLFLFLNAGSLVASAEEYREDLELLVAKMEAEIEARTDALEKADEDHRAVVDCNGVVKDELNGINYKIGKLKKAISDRDRTVRIKDNKEKIKQLKKFETETEAFGTSREQLKAVALLLRHDLKAQRLEDVTAPISILLMPKQLLSEVTICSNKLESLVAEEQFFYIQKGTFTVNKATIASFKESKLRYQTLIWDIYVAPTKKDLKGVVNLTFGSSFNLPIADDVLPFTLTHLTFGDSFNQPIAVGVLPPNLTHLTFGRFFNKHLDPDVFPHTLTHLTFGYHFDQPIAEGILPPNLTHLTLGYYFDQHLDPGVFPHTLTHLTLGGVFKHHLVPGVFPHTLTNLTFEHCFNLPIAAGVLPLNLTHLTLGEHFGQPIPEGALPNLIHLIVSEFYSDDYIRAIALPVSCIISKK